jgi:hypothetical protein
VYNRDFTDIVKGHSDWFSTDNAKFIAGTIILALEDKNDEQSDA